nr:hypothetical protein [uncultured bacterium]
MYIVARFIDYLESIDELNGTIHILPSANPAAQFVNTRVSPLDYKDLNRAGRGNSEGSYTDRLGAKLYDFLVSCDFVVNIHEFEMLTPTTAVFMNAGSKDIKTKTLAAIKSFAPDIIWVIDASQNQDVQYQATLDTALTEAGVANFPIETTQLLLMNNNEIDRIARGLMNVAAHFGIVSTLSNSSHNSIPAYVRHEITANYSGLWEPKEGLMRQVNQGEEIGVLRQLPDFQRRVLYSPLSGVLIQYRKHQVVSTGTSLIGIGSTVQSIITAYE